MEWYTLFYTCKEYLSSWFDYAHFRTLINTLRPRQNGRHFPDDTFKWIFLNGNVWVSIEVSLKFVPKCPINNIPALVQIMAWRRPGDKPLSQPMVVCLLTHICVTRPQWVQPFIANLGYWQICVEHILPKKASSPHNKKLTTGLIYEECCVSCDFYHNSSQIVKHVLPCTSWNVVRDLLKSVYGNMISYRQVNWNFAAI